MGFESDSRGQRIWFWATFLQTQKETKLNRKSSVESIDQLNDSYIPHYCLENNTSIIRP